MAAYIHSGSLASELTGTPAQNPWAKSRGMDGRVSQNLEQGTLMQIPLFPQILPCFKNSSTRLLAFNAVMQ